MIDFIPLEYYSVIYYNVLLVFILIIFLQTQILPVKSTYNLKTIKIIGYGLLTFVLVYIGLRPVDGAFVDMTTYAYIFENFKEEGEVLFGFDYIFFFMTYYLAQYISVEFYFFICTLLYVFPLYLVSKKWFHEYWLIAFLLLVGSFSFWAYGTNGIRNGIAGSIFLLAISQEKRLSQTILLLISVGFHFSMLLPVAGFVLAQFYNKPKHLIFFWLLCIPLSLALPDFWENFFANLGLGDERLEFLTVSGFDRATRPGFRWDFLIYSSTAIFAGWFYIVKKGFSDKIYYWLFNTYVFSNAFWVLVIRANFSNRFAYLSWFMIALVIIYPLLREDFYTDQYKRIGYVILGYFSFTYFMGVII